MKINKKIINILIILMSLINITLAILLFIRRYSIWEFYTNSFILISLLQIIAIISSIISLKFIYSRKTKILTILSIVMLLITFFIPIQKSLIFPSSKNGISPDVMPEECKQNIYGITIFSKH